MRIRRGPTDNFWEILANVHTEAGLLIVKLDHETNRVQLQFGGVEVGIPFGKWLRIGRWSKDGIRNLTERPEESHFQNEEGFVVELGRIEADAERVRNRLSNRKSSVGTLSQEEQKLLEWAEFIHIFVKRWDELDKAYSNRFHNAKHDEEG